MIRTVGYTGLMQANAAEESYAHLGRILVHMHAAMMRSGSSDPNYDFAVMMVPHQEGAIETADAELRFGHDPVLRRLTHGIIIEQHHKIAIIQQSRAALQPSPIGPVRQVVDATAGPERRTLVIVEGAPVAIGRPVQTQR